MEGNVDRLNLLNQIDDIQSRLCYKTESGLEIKNILSKVKWREEPLVYSRVYCLAEIIAFTEKYPQTIKHIIVGLKEIIEEQKDSRPHLTIVNKSEEIEKYFPIFNIPDNCEKSSSNLCFVLTYETTNQKYISILKKHEVHEVDFDFDDTRFASRIRKDYEDEIVHILITIMSRLLEQYHKSVINYDYLDDINLLKIVRV